MKKFFALVLALVMCAAMFAACGGTTPPAEGGEAAPEGDTIKVGFIGPLTGSTAQYGEAVSNGAQLYFDRLNAGGGIGGKQVEFIKMDSKGDPTDAANAYTRLVDEDGVCAIIGPVLTGETLAVAELAAEDGIPCVTASATGDSITDIGDSLFRTCYTDSYQGTNMANYAADVLGYKKVAVLFNNSDEYSTGLANAFRAQAEAKGITIVANESFVTDDTDFKSQLTNINNAAPDAVYYPGYYNDCYMAAQQAKEVGLTVPFLGGDGLSGLVGIEGVDPAVIEGFVFTNHFDPSGNETATAFAAEYEGKFSVAPMGFSFLAADAAMIIAEGVKNAGTEKTALVAAMKATDMDCITGPYIFDANNNPTKQTAMIKIADGAEVFDQMF